MADTQKLIEHMNAKTAAFNQGRTLWAAMHNCIDPLRELHVGRTKKERTTWTKALSLFVRAAKNAHQSEAFAKKAGLMEGSDVGGGIEALAASLLKDALGGSPTSQLAALLDQLPEDDARAVRLDAYRIAVGFVNNCHPVDCVPENNRPNEYTRGIEPQPEHTLIHSQLTAAESIANGTTGDNKRDKKIKYPRRVTAEVVNCADDYRKALRKDPGAKRIVTVREFVKERGGSEHTINKTLGEHPDLWKPGDNGTKSGQNAGLEP